MLVRLPLMLVTSPLFCLLLVTCTIFSPNFEMSVTSPFSWALPIPQNSSNQPRCSSGWECIVSNYCSLRWDGTWFKPPQNLSHMWNTYTLFLWLTNLGTNISLIFVNHWVRHCTQPGTGAACLSAAPLTSRELEKWHNIFYQSHDLNICRYDFQ